jgi:hypothetical protein
MRLVMDDGDGEVVKLKPFTPTSRPSCLKDKQQRVSATTPKAALAAIGFIVVNVRCRRQNEYVRLARSEFWGTRQNLHLFSFHVSKQKEF